MTLGFGTSAAHPLYLYIVFVICVVGTVALIVAGVLTRRRNSWHYQMQATPRVPQAQQPVYPAEPHPARTTAQEPAAPAAVSRTATKTATKKTAAARKTTAAKKATAAKKTAARTRARQ